MCVKFMSIYQINFSIIIVNRYFEMLPKKAGGFNIGLIFVYSHHGMTENFQLKTNWDVNPDT